MKNITINYKNASIEITKTFAKQARVFNSTEYKLLQEARRENNGFTVVVVAPKKNSSKNGKVTLADMERYISFHDDEEHSIMREFNARRHAKENGALCAHSFFEIKKWFFEVFPDAA